MMPAPAPSPSAAPVRAALILSLVVAFVMPIFFFVVPLLTGASMKTSFDGTTFFAVVALLAVIGAGLWLAALVTSILTCKRAVGDPKTTTAGWTSIGLCVLALFTGAVAWFFGIIFGMGGGPH